MSYANSRANGRRAIMSLLRVFPTIAIAPIFPKPAGRTVYDSVIYPDFHHTPWSSLACLTGDPPPRLPIGPDLRREQTPVYHPQQGNWGKMGKWV